MRELITWLTVALILLCTTAVALRPADARTAPVVEGPPDSAPLVVVPYREIAPEPPPVDPRSWCEPLDLPPCLPDGAPCPAASDGTPRVCVPERWVAGSHEHVCLARKPTRAVQRWRAARLRVLVDAICKRSQGCDPAQLHDYLAVLALRESSWRPYVVHRLVGDREAASAAWRRNAHRYVDSPAHDEPWRWVSRGYYGQNSAYLVARWDVTAVPEILCGEVESTLVHLRVARDRWRRLERGVECDGAEHHGTATGRPSWYDMAQTNGGAEACPGTEGRPLAVRLGFERRARSRGLNPYGAVTLARLGREVPQAEQDAFARSIRAEMDRLHPRP